MAKRRSAGATARASAIGIWALVIILSLVVIYTLANLIVGAISPNMTFTESFTSFFGLANKAAETSAEAGATALAASPVALM